MFKGKKVSFHTLGCKLNFSETSTLARMFIEQGFSKVDFGEPADVTVINTCTVTDVADKKCRQAIKKAISKSPGGFVAVIGCYASNHADEISQIDGVDVIIDAKNKFKIFEILNDLQKNNNSQILHNTENTDTFEPAYSAGDRTRSFLKIQDGCDYFCAYCTVPHARGRSRNGSIESIVKSAKEIANQGIKEIILTGINLGDFGKSTHENLIDLLVELDALNAVERYRISSIEPDLLKDEIISFVAGSKRFMPHFHIPLQSGSNSVLKIMGRRYNTDLFTHKINQIKKSMPHAFIGVDVIVGTPGETDEYFIETKNLLENLNISELHVFNYSVREKTKAATFQNKVPYQIKKQRSNELLELSEKKIRNFYQSNIGCKALVLFESYNDKGFMYGYTENYLRVVTPYKKELVNTIAPVEIIQVNHKGLLEIKIL